MGNKNRHRRISWMTGTRTREPRRAKNYPRVADGPLSISAQTAALRERMSRRSGHAGKTYARCKQILSVARCTSDSPIVR
jgi:hypothetical protein